MHRFLDDPAQLAALKHLLWYWLVSIWWAFVIVWVALLVGVVLTVLVSLGPHAPTG